MTITIKENVLRDRPFNLGGGGYGFFFSDNTRVRIFCFYVAQSANFQNLTLGYMTNTLNQIIFFLHHNQNIFLEQ